MGRITQGREGGRAAPKPTPCRGVVSERLLPARLHFSAALPWGSSTSCHLDMHSNPAPCFWFVTLSNFLQLSSLDCLERLRGFNEIRLYVAASPLEQDPQPCYSLLLVGGSEPLYLLRTLRSSLLCFPPIWPLCPSKPLPFSSLAQHCLYPEDSG